MEITVAFVLQLISTAIMIIGVAFGVQNIRQYRASRRRESSIMILNSFQTPDFVRGLLVIFDLPADAGKQELDALPADQSLAVFMVLGTWERLGVLVFRRELDLALVDDAYSGPIVQSWQKLERYVKEFRAYVGRDTAFEWFQWLAERMIEREAKSGGAIPAYVAHRDWKAAP